MNDLDDLRDALHSPPGFVARSLDLDAIMTSGGRRRRARRLAVSGTSGLAVVAVLIGGGWLAARDDRAAPGLLPPAAASPSPSPTPSAPPTDGPPSDGPATAPLGAVVSTGLKAKQGTWVIYAVPVREPSLPGTHFGIMVGRRMPDGAFTSDVISNETTGSGTAKGFHALQGAMNVNGEDIPPFGYFVGSATKITAKAGSKTIEAGHAYWSKDAAVVMFWFDPAKIGAARLTKLTAYGANGNKLPAGKTEFGVG